MFLFFSLISVEKYWDVALFLYVEMDKVNVNKHFRFCLLGGISVPYFQGQVCISNRFSLGIV